MTITKDQLKKILGFEDCELTIWQDGTALNFTHIEVKGERLLMDEERIREALWKAYPRYFNVKGKRMSKSAFTKGFRAGYKSAYTSLKAENEQMRCCGNCKHQIDCDYADLDFNGCDNWEMKE